MTHAKPTLQLARQHLETDQLLGIDFIPMPPKQAPTQSSSAAPDQLDAADAAAALEQLRIQHDESCPHCAVVTGHTQTVFGEGNPNAALMFIGEAPGQEEDRTGRPFVGRAGQKLDQMIQAMGLSRDEVYITNILKSRPPDNRTPLRGEVEACAPFLHKQIRIIRPRVIVTLGGPATQLLLSTDEGISRLRGTWSEYHDPEASLTIPVMPTFHPAYLLRNYTPETRKKIWSDLQAVLAQLAADA